MSTFKGVVQEFPDIRIDYFRVIPDKPQPLAVFLSHVHSDHLYGLESLRAPFVYCSASTRELLLRLEKYPHRMNFAKGILESRRQHYKHLKNLLKPIPLGVPTTLELKPGRSIRVTLLDANHCPGAVMFLVEDSHHAILYTGDIRAEAWWVNSIIRNPIILPFAVGGARTLDKIYLDTTYASREEQHRHFPSKADGIQHLLEKVSQYPKTTVFHLNSWTFGYEDAWIALASALKSQVHVDSYKYNMYKALASQTAGQVPSHEGSALLGFTCGNHHHAGCLTNDKTVRLHICEPGSGCHAAISPTTVYITLVIHCTEGGTVMPEAGASLGGDLSQYHNYLELDAGSGTERLLALCETKIRDSQTRSETVAVIKGAMESKSKSISLGVMGLDGERQIALEELPDLLSRYANPQASDHPDENDKIGHRKSKSLPSRIVSQDNPTKQPRNENTYVGKVFPYSRHSSYEELCHFVGSFRPREIYPCVVDEKDWAWENSMANLFGSLCHGHEFVHDDEMLGQVETRTELKRPRESSESQQTHTTSSHLFDSPPTSHPHHKIQRPNSSASISQPNPESSEPPIQPSMHSFFNLKNPKYPVLNLPSIKTSLQFLCAKLTSDNTKKADDTQSTHYSSSSDGDFPFEPAPSPPPGADTITTSTDKDPESQLTLSDAAFESSQHSDIAIFPQTRAVQLHQRKEAYRAVRENSGAWGTTLGLISAGADHGSEEVEL